MRPMQARAPLPARGVTMIIRLSQSEGEDANTREKNGMAAVGQMPERDREFEALLRSAAEFQKADIGCKLRGEAV